MSALDVNCFLNIGKSGEEVRPLRAQCAQAPMPSSCSWACKSGQPHWVVPCHMTGLL